MHAKTKKNGVHCFLPWLIIEVLDIGFILGTLDILDWDDNFFLKERWQFLNYYL